jgi:hypothetical protein
MEAFVNMLQDALEHANVVRRRATTMIALLSTTLAFAGCGGDSGTTGPTLSADASLSALQIVTGTLIPIFTSGTTSYTVSVSNGTAFEIVRPTATNVDAKITVNGAPLESGAASSGIALAVGANTITIVVTAADQVTTRAYTIVVTRASTITTS